MSIVVFSSNQEQKYYELTEASLPSVIVLGEQSENWTSLTLTFFKKSDVPVFFFTWAKIADLRLNLELTRYPVSQLWRNGGLIKECVGYREEDLHKLANRYFSEKR